MTPFYDSSDDEDEYDHPHHHHFDHNPCQGELGDTLLWELLEQLNLQHLVAVGGLEAMV